MHFWNEDNFRGLLEIADRLSDDPRMTDLAEYCRLREAGRRGEAFRALAEFVTAAKAASGSDQINMADMIYGIAHSAPRVHQFLAHPLRTEFLEPTLTRWLIDESDSAQALRWDGIFRRNLGAFERALSLDPSDDVSRRYLIEWQFLDPIEFAFHHIDEGVILSEADLIEEWIMSAEALIGAAPVPADFTVQTQELAEHRGLLSDFLEFKAEGEKSFPEWCRAKGRVNAFTKAYYYNFF